MVWGLFPVDPLSGENTYYIFSKGTYKVGRKGCDVIVNRDKAVSRIHAEIVIDEMIPFDQLHKKSSNTSSKVRIRDCSKYGTFINKNLDSMEKVHEFPDREKILKDGDIVSFGNGSATYRFSFVPFIFFNLCSVPVKRNQVLKSKISLIGATATENWNSDCTHVLVDDFMPLKENAVDAIVAKKPLIVQNWVEFIAEMGICTEIPSCYSYAPTLTFEDLSVKVAIPSSRESCLRGYTFLLESTHKYIFKNKMCLLIEVAGAKADSLEGFYPSSQGCEDQEYCRMVQVIPAGSADSLQYIRKHTSAVYRVNENSLISAILSGHLDPSIIVSPPVVISSSCSTDETVVADSDVEMETATSAPTSIPVLEIKSDECQTKDEIPIHATTETTETVEYQNKTQMSTDYPGFISRDAQVIDYTIHKVESLESENVDIIYTEDLIVRDTYVPDSINPYVPDSINPSVNGAVLNFKRFRKMGETESGNSYGNLIPFAKHPYGDCDYDNDEVAESVKEEKRRKQMEAAAEDLFKYEKGKGRSGAGSIRGFLTPTR